MTHTNEKILILDNIRSTYNVGALFRTADAIGISCVYLVGITPTPIDQFNRPRKDIAKSALGSEQTVAWKYAKTMTPLIKRLKKEGFQIIAIEQAPESVDYKKVIVAPKSAFILGTEVTGLTKAVLAQCDIVAEIPMRGSKESLNVSVAAGVALFGMLDK